MQSRPLWGRTPFSSHWLVIERIDCWGDALGHLGNGVRFRGRFRLGEEADCGTENFLSEHR